MVAVLRAPPWDEGLNRFTLDCSDTTQLFQPIMGPLGPVVARATGPIVVDRLDMAFVETLPHRAFVFTVTGSAEIQLRRRIAKTSTRYDKAVGSESECESEADDASGADVQSVVSEREAEAEHEDEEVQNVLGDDEGAQEELAAIDRAPAGTHVDVLGPDGYFTLINNPGWENLKMLVKPRRCKDLPDGMGTDERFSRTLYPRDFGEAKANPVITKLVLCSWKLCRSTHAGFHQSSAARKSWYADQLHHLGGQLRALGRPEGRTGSPAADAYIVGWAPDAFVA